MRSEPPWQSAASLQLRSRGRPGAPQLIRLNGGSFRRSMRGSMHRPSSHPSNTHRCTITARLCGFSFESRCFVLFCGVQVNPLAPLQVTANCSRIHIRTGFWLGASNQWPFDCHCRTFNQFTGATSKPGFTHPRFTRVAKKTSD